MKKQQFLLSESVKQEYAGLSPSLVPLIPIKIRSSVSLFRDSDLRTSTKEATFFSGAQRFHPQEEKRTPLFSQFPEREKKQTRLNDNTVYSTRIANHYYQRITLFKKIKKYLFSFH